MPVLIVQSAVLQAKAVVLQMFQCNRGPVRFRLKSIVEPELVGRRNRPHGGYRMTVIDDAAKVVTIYRRRYGPPETCRSEPISLIGRNRRVSHLIKPHEFGVKRGPRVMNNIWRTRCQTVKIFGI